MRKKFIFIFLFLFFILSFNCYFIIINEEELENKISINFKNENIDNEEEIIFYLEEYIKIDKVNEI